MQKTSTLTPVQRKLLGRNYMANVISWFAKSARLSREWDSLVQKSIAQYGERPQGGHISGIYSEHFPQEVQITLRDLAHGVTAASNEAWNARPKYVHARTMRALRLAVHARDGSGFYG